MVVNWEISIGNMIEVSMLMVGGLWTLFSIRGRVDVIGRDVKRLETRAGLSEQYIEEIKRALTAIAVQNERLNNFDSRLTMLRNDYRDLARGEGFILPLNPKGGPK